MKNILIITVLTNLWIRVVSADIAASFSTEDMLMSQPTNEQEKKPDLMESSSASDTTDRLMNALIQLEDDVISSLENLADETAKNDSSMVARLMKKRASYLMEKKNARLMEKDASNETGLCEPANSSNCRSNSNSAHSDDLDGIIRTIVGTTRPPTGENPLENIEEEEEYVHLFKSIAESVVAPFLEDMEFLGYAQDFSFPIKFVISMYLNKWKEPSKIDEDAVAKSCYALIENSLISLGSYRNKELTDIWSVLQCTHLSSLSERDDCVQDSTRNFMRYFTPTSKIKHYELVMEDKYQNDKDLIKELTNKLKEKGFSVQDSITFKNTGKFLAIFHEGMMKGPELLFLYDDTFYNYYPKLKLLKEIIDSNKIYMPFLFNLAYGIIYGESTDSIVSDTIESVTQEVANIGKIWEAIRELSNTEGSAIQELISFLDNNVVANKPERATKCVNLSCKRVKLPMLKIRMDPPELSDEEQNLEAASNGTFEFSIFLHIWPHLEKGELASTVLTSLEKEDFNVTFEKDQLHINSKLKFDVSRMGEDTTGKDGHTDARQGLIEYGETYFGERITLVPETIEEIGETIKIGEKYYTLNMSYQVAVFKYISRIERGVRLYISLIPGSGNGAHKPPNNILEIKSLRSLGASAFSDIICRRLDIEEGSNKNVNFSISLGGALYLSDFGLTPREELPLSGFVSLCDSSELSKLDNSSWVELGDTETKENPLMANKSDAATDDVSKS